MTFLSQQTEPPVLKPEFFVHVIDESVTPHKSWKTKIGNLASGGVLYVNNTTLTNTADLNKNILDTFNVPANTLNQDGDSLEVECVFKRTTPGHNFYCYIDTPNDTVTGAMTNISPSPRSKFVLKITRISQTTYSRTGFMVQNGTAYAMITNKNLACDFTTDFTINFAIANLNVADQGSAIDFIWVNLIKLFANGLSSNLPKVYKALLSQTAPATITSGSLIVGETYTITTFVAGDDFANVANVQSGTINTTGCVFIATGDTPTDYSNGSTLDSAGNPTAIIFVNTIGDIVWTRDSAGLFFGTLAGAFILNKVFCNPVGIGETVIIDNTNPPNYFLFRNDTDSVGLETIKLDGTLYDDQLGKTPIEITIYN